METQEGKGWRQKKTGSRRDRGRLRGRKWKCKRVRERPCIGFVVVLSCLLVLRDQPVPPRRGGSGLSQRTQAALLAEAPWHGCGCCCQSVTDSSYSLHLFSHYSLHPSLLCAHSLGKSICRFDTDAQHGDDSWLRWISKQRFCIAQ